MQNTYSDFITILINKNIESAGKRSVHKNLYSAWIKIEENLPWLELKGTYQTRKEAKEAAKKFLNDAQVKIITIPEKPKEIKAMTIIKTT